MNEENNKLKLEIEELKHRTNELEEKLKSYTNPTPQVEMLVQLLSYVGLARRKGMIINKASIYNPIHGNLYTWDVSQWTLHDELIEFMSDCVKN